MSDAQHGSPSTYQNRNCRCQECRSAWARYALEAKARRTARLAADPTLASHGAESTYGNWGCRCPDCLTGRAKAVRERRRRAKQRARDST